MQSDKRATVASVDRTLKDMFPRPGMRIKQWVVDRWRESEWEHQTCPRFNVDPHLDNTGCECRNSGETSFKHLNHDCCSTCEDLYELANNSQAVMNWLAERAKRPDICADRDKFSDEIAPDPRTYEHPLLAMLPREPK